MVILRRARIGLVILLSFLGTRPAAGDWKEAHKLGVEALEAGRFDEAERFFRAAIDERSDERVNRLLKVNYLPHYYLGVALAEQGRCRPAIDSWQETNRQEQIKKSKVADDLDQRLETCRSQLRQVDAASAEVQRLIETVAAAEDSLRSLAQTPELAPQWRQGSPSFESRQKSAMQSLAEARSLLAEGKTRDDLDRLGSAKTRANQALNELESTAVAARQRLGELGAATASALEDLDEVEEEARKTLASIADLAPYPRRLGARVAAVQNTLSEIAERQPGASSERLDVLRNELAASLASLKRSARRPPEVLTRAAEAFFANQFEEVLNLLEGVDSGTNKARSHLCLLRSAARHSLWILGGEDDEQLLDLATADIKTCSEIDPLLLPSPKFFSPRFVDFHTLSLQDLARAAEEEAAAGKAATLEATEGEAATVESPEGPSSLASPSEALDEPSSKAQG